MSDMRALHDAFGELERRADAVSPGVQPALPRPRRAFSMRLAVPVAATVAAVAGLAGAAVWLAPGGDEGNTRAASSGTTSSTTIAVPPAPEWTGIPKDADQLIAQFKVVLGDTATFEVTDTNDRNNEAPQSVSTDAPEQPNTPPAPTGATSITSKPNDDGASSGAAIVGKFTAGGVTGGFDLQIYAGTPGEVEACVIYMDLNTCNYTTLPDGRTLITGVYELVEPGGVTYQARLTDPDGRVILMHISNMGDPKGAGGVLAPQPPLTADQLTAIVTSDRW